METVNDTGFMAQVLALLIPAVIGALVAWLRTKSKMVDKLIGATATQAVQREEEVTVRPYKENHNVTKIPPVTQAEAKRNAMLNVADTLLPLLGPAGQAADAFLDKHGAAISQAIETAVQNSKKRVPKKTASLFRALLPFAIVAATLPIHGCALLSVPSGWDTSDGDAVQTISEALKHNVYAVPVSDRDAAQVAIAAAGDAGAAAFKATGKLSDDLDVEYQLRGAVAAAQEYYRTFYPDLAGTTPLPQAVRYASGVIGSDADQLLGLILAALER